MISHKRFLPGGLCMCVCSIQTGDFVSGYAVQVLRQSLVCSRPPARPSYGVVAQKGQWKNICCIFVLSHEIGGFGWVPGQRPGGHLTWHLQLFVAKKQSLNWEKGSCRVRCYKASGPMVGFDPSPCPTDAVLPSRHLLQSYGKETIYFDGWPDLFIFFTTHRKLWNFHSAI